MSWALESSNRLGVNNLKHLNRSRRRRRECKGEQYYSTPRKLANYVVLFVNITFVNWPKVTKLVNYHFSPFKSDKSCSYCSRLDCEKVFTRLILNSHKDCGSLALDIVWLITIGTSLERAWLRIYFQIYDEDVQMKQTQYRQLVSIMKTFALVSR